MTGISEVIANMNLPALVKQEPMETDDFADVHQFFSDEEWSMMNDVWKQRCRQLKQNYDMLRMFGVEPDLPDFMAGKDYTYTGPVNNLAAVVASSAISKVQLQSSASATELAAPPPSTTPKLEPRMLKRKPPPPKTGGRKFSRFHKRRRVKIEEESDDDQEEIKIDRTETDCILLLEDVLQTVTEAIEHEELFDPDIDEDLTVEEQEEKLLANYFFRIHNRTMIIIDKRPFHCQFCDKTYARRPDLARHEKSAHRESVLLPPVRQPKLEIKEEPPSMEPEEEGVSYRLRKRKVYFTPEMGGGIPLSGMTPAIPEQVAVSEPVVVREPKFKNKEILGKYTKRLKGRKRNFLLGRHLQCVACSKLFNSLRAFRLHQGIHTATPSRCKQCFATFKLRKCLSSHYKRFHTVHAYKCFFCPTMMGRMRELRGHMSVCPNKDKKRHTCGICGKGFRDSMEHKRHAATHYNPGKPHQCDQCGRGFRTTKNLRRHVFKSHKDGNQYHCSKCSKSFPSKEDLGQHRLSVHGVAIMITCEICTKVCYGKSALERHMLAAHGNRPFKCKICTKPFARIAHLERHEKEVHGGLGDFVCNVCGTPFKRKDRLIRHQQTVHTEGNNGSMRRRRPPRPRAPYDPTNSGGSGSGGATREVGQTSFLCQICGAVFSKQHRLHRHTENVHGVYRDYDSQVTPVVAPPPSFDCKLCGRVFKCREYLSRHETYVHGNEGGDTTAGGFLCFSCGKSFKCKMYLHKHERSVHGIEADSSSTLQPQFACNDCGALFKRREYLRRHESHVHKKESVDLLETPAGSFTTPAGEQSAINVCNCQFCGKAFADESYLRRHEAEFHGTSASGSEFSFSFTCDLCGRGFKRGQLLNRHYKTQHGQDRGGGVTARTPRSSTGGGGGNGSGGTPSSRKPKKPKTEPKCSQDAAIAAVVMNGLSTAFEQRTSNVAGGGANNNVGSAVVVQVTEHQPQQQQPHPQQPQQQIAFERHPMVANALAFDHMAPYAPNQLQAINFQMNQMNNHHHHHPGINAAVTHAHTGPSTHAHTHQAAMGQQLNTHTLNSQLNQLSQQNNDLSGLLAEFFSNPHSSQLTSGPYYTLL